MREYGQLRLSKARKILSIFVAIFLFSGKLHAGQMERVIVLSSGSRDVLDQEVQKLRLEVRHRFENVNAAAVMIPKEALPQLDHTKGLTVIKDVSIPLPRPR